MKKTKNNSFLHIYRYKRKGKKQKFYFISSLLKAIFPTNTRKL